MNAAQRTAALDPYDALVGAWETTATHPYFGDLEVPGRTVFEWLEGGQFLIGRARNEHADFPDNLTVIGADGDGLAMHYYDSRGVERVYRTSFEDRVLRIWRDVPGFAQRFTARVSDDGATLDGQWELCRDGTTWQPDLGIVYRRG